MHRIHTFALVALSILVSSSSRAASPLPAQEASDARALYSHLLAQHAEAAALDVVATVERRVEQLTASAPPSTGTGQGVAPRVTNLVIEGEAHLAHPAAGWLKTSTIELESKASGDASPSESAAVTLPNPTKKAKPVELFELVGDGTGVFEINRSSRRVAPLGTEWFAVFPELSLVSAWTGLTLPAPRSVAFVQDQRFGNCRGLRVERGAPDGSGRQSTEILWLDQDNQLVAAESESSGPEFKRRSEYKFRVWRLSDQVDLESYIRKPPAGFADWDVLGQSEVAALLDLGSPAPSVTLHSLEEGKEDLLLDNLRGEALLLTFWFVDCPGCDAVLPRVQALFEELSKERDDVRFIGIGMGEKPEEVAASWQAAGFTYPTYLQATDEVSRAFGVRRYPTTYVIDKDGRVLWRSYGLEEATVRAILAATR